jgi:tripartite-type tricarboxylate transporter receptor subunit TctC
MNLTTFSRRTFIAACTLAAASLAHAAWPERPITLVVPYAPGGSADALARVLAAKIGATLGTTVLVDNKGGASGTIGASYVAKAQPDGYTMLYDATPYSINPHLFATMPFAPTALQPLSLVSLAPNIVIVKADSPLKDLKDLIAKAKAQPGKVNFASGGSGTVQRLAAELFRQKLGLDMVHVPYKSGGPAITDVMGGQVDFMFSTVAASTPLVAGGKLRALAISSSKRADKMPNVPTVAELAIPGYEVYEWNGVFVEGHAGRHRVEAAEGRRERSA